MFVRNVRDAAPFLAADLSEIRLLVDRANVGIASVSLAHATVAAGSETVVASIGTHRRDLLHSVWARAHLGGRRISRGGAGDTVWIPAGIPQRIQNLSSAPLAFLCACGPAYVPECDQPARGVTLIEARHDYGRRPPRQQDARGGNLRRLRAPDFQARFVARARIPGSWFSNCVGTARRWRRLPRRRLRPSIRQPRGGLCRGARCDQRHYRRGECVGEPRPDACPDRRGVGTRIRPAFAAGYERRRARSGCDVPTPLPRFGIDRIGRQRAKQDRSGIPGPAEHPQRTRPHRSAARSGRCGAAGPSARDFGG